MSNLKRFLHELKHHYPFTLIATISAVLISLLILYILKIQIKEDLFHSLHLIHLLASSMVSAGIFYRYKRNIFYALIVGIISSILIGSISDIIFPWLGASILNLGTIFHLPLLEIPLIVISISILGSLLGIWIGKTKVPHLIHVLLSVFASLFYLLTFTPEFNLLIFLPALLIVFIAVIIPCCISDILFPFFFLKKPLKSCDCDCY